MIHFDMDALDSTYFRSTLFGDPYGAPIDAPEGTMHLHEVVDLVRAILEETDVVGFGITEHIPWDIIHLRDSLAQMSLFND